MNRFLCKLPLLLALALAANCHTAQAQTQTLHYPTTDQSMFSIKAPADWEVTSIDEVGDFGTLESESGSVLQFRAVELQSEEEAKNEVDSIFDSTAKFLSENFTDISLDEPTEINVNGQPGAQLTGTGKDKDGDEVAFLSAMIALGPTTVAEIWAAVLNSDDLAQAQKTLNSYSPSSD